MPFTTDQTVRLEDTTSADTLFYVRVLTYLNRVVEDLLSAVGYPYAENFADRDLGLLVAHVDIDYLVPASLGTEFDVSVTPTVRESSIVFEATGTADGEVVFRAREVRVPVTLSTKEQRAVPDALAAGLAEYAT